MSYLPALALILAGYLLAPLAMAYTELSFPDSVHNLTPEPGSSADYARIVALTDGTLVTVWIQAAGPADGAWDPEGTPFPPRDVFLRYSTDDGATWSAPLNVSNTATLTDPTALYDPVGDGLSNRSYYGDSAKASVFSVGSLVLVAWNDTYCGPGRHGPARYAVASGFVEVPFRCVYAARIDLTDGDPQSVVIDQISDASRDANNEVARGTGAGFALAWQEDPQGLQLGEARGEGDGASGAPASQGTDIWYTWLPAAAFADPGSAWRSPVPISNNYDYLLDTTLGGGASRPTLALAGSPPRALLTYEEAKAVAPSDPGKHVIYHEFPATQPATSQAGVIVSSPDENARRARVVAQGTPGNTHGTRMVLIWRQGEGIQGAPADVLMRVGRVPVGTSVTSAPDAGFRVADLWPPVDAADPAASAPALNLSAARLDEATGAEPLADAKAHRAVLDGDLIFAGFTSDPDPADDAQGYAYLVRTSEDGGSTWSPPADVSTPGSGTADVIEPRLLRTPGTLPTGDPRDVRNPDVHVFAWGTQITQPGSNVTVPEALYVTRSLDRGATFEPVQRLTDSVASTADADEGIQLRVTPDGNLVSAVWIRASVDETDAVFTRGVGVTRTADLAITAAASNTAPDIAAPVDVTFSIANMGPDTATKPALTIVADPGLDVRSIVSGSGDCDTEPPVRCELDELAAGDEASVTVTVAADVAGAYPISAAARSPEEEPWPADNETTLTLQVVPRADVSIQLRTDRTRLERGDAFRLDYRVSNAGPQDATGAVVSISLPVGLTVESAGACSGPQTHLRCELIVLPPGETAAGSLRLRVDTKENVVVAATATAAEEDPDPADNSDYLGIRPRRQSGGGCTVNPGLPADPTLPLTLLGALAYRLRRLHHGRGPGR
jgi:hypothetical protein